MARKPNPEPDFDRELADLPPELRWREWKARVEAVLFAAPKPVIREVKRVNVDFPVWVIEALDREASRSA